MHADSQSHTFSLSLSHTHTHPTQTSPSPGAWVARWAGSLPSPTTPPRGGLPGPSASWPPHLLLGAGRAGRGGFPAQQASLAAQRASFPRPLGSRLPGDLPGLWCFLRVCSEKEGPWGEGLSSVRLWMPRFALGWGALISQGRLFQAPACCDVFLRGPVPSTSLGANLLGAWWHSGLLGRGGCGLPVLQKGVFPGERWASFHSCLVN